MASGATVSLHQRLLMVAHRMALLWRCGPLPVAPELPAPSGRVQCGLEQIVQIRGDLRVLDLNQHLDSPVEIAVHHVGAADPELVDVIEMNDQRELQESAENRADRT